MKDENPAYYSIIEFAKKIGVHPNTVRNNIKNGSINAFRLSKNKNSSYRISANEIERMTWFTMKKYNEELKNLYEK